MPFTRLFSVDIGSELDGTHSVTRETREHTRFSETAVGDIHFKVLADATAVNENCNRVTPTACMGIRRGNLPWPAGCFIINLTAPNGQA